MEVLDTDNSEFRLISSESFSGIVEDNEKYIPQEVRVFRSVIWQLINDAARNCTDLCPVKKQVAEWEKQQARIWLLHNKVDFEIVCDLAMLDPKYVREKVRRYLNERQAAM